MTANSPSGHGISELVELVPTPVHADRLLAEGQFDELRDFVDRAASGEIDLDDNQERDSSADGKLPTGWYLKPVENLDQPLLQRSGLRPEVAAGLLGLGAGLVILLPLAFWWQQALPNRETMPASLVAVSAVSNASATEERVDLVAVKSVQVAKAPEHPSVTEARSFIADGEVLAARAVLAQATAARDPEGLFLMAETYDPNMLAAQRARGVGSDAERARALYMAAKGLGHARAAARLQALR